MYLQNENSCYFKRNISRITNSLEIKAGWLKKKKYKGEKTKLRKSCRK